MPYGLRYFDCDKPVQLMQISGGGRVLLEAPESNRTWWSAPPDVQWEVFETSDGQTYNTMEEARDAASNFRK